MPFPEMEQAVHILLVDDDEDDREIFAWVVKGIDPALRVDIASDGFEALGLLNGEGIHFDVIFLDLNMPKLHGMDVLRRIRQMERRRETPVIVYSTSSNPHDREDAVTAGASGYIVKGYELPVMREELRQALKKYVPRLTHTYEE